MALPKSYLTSLKNLGGILDAMRAAQAPEKFTTRFLASLGFSNAADRLIINVLESLGFLKGDRAPTERYFRYLDQTQSAVVMAEALRDAYSDLFKINKNAQKLSRAEIVNKLKTLSQGQLSQSVLDKTAATFLALAKHADFEAKPSIEAAEINEEKKEEAEDEPTAATKSAPITYNRSLGGLHYNIQLILPASRDPSVYDALFRSLREHLL